MLKTASPTTTPNLSMTDSNSSNDSRLPFRSSVGGGGVASSGNNSATPPSQSSSRIITTSTIKPSKYDVLLGNSKEARLHFGTEYLNGLIVDTYHEYHAADRATDYLDRERGKKSKQDINKEIYTMIQEKGGRFLQKSKKTKKWEEIDIQRAINRISSSFGHKSIAERVQKLDEEKKKKKQPSMIGETTTTTTAGAAGAAATTTTTVASSTGEQKQPASVASVSSNGTTTYAPSPPPPPSVEAPTSSSATTTPRMSGKGGGLSGVAKMMQRGVVKMVKRARSRDFGSISSSASDTSSPPQSLRSIGEQQQQQQQQPSRTEQPTARVSQQQSSRPVSSFSATRPSSLPSSVAATTSTRVVTEQEQKLPSTRTLPDFDKPHEYTMTLPGDDDDDDDDASTSSGEEYDHDEELLRTSLLRQRSSLPQDSIELDRMPLRMESESSVLMNPELAEQLAAESMEPMPILNHHHMPSSTTNNQQQQQHAAAATVSDRQQQHLAAIAGATPTSPSGPPEHNSFPSAFVNKALLFQQRQMREDYEEPQNFSHSDNISFEYDSARFLRSAHLSTDLMDTFDDDENDDDVAKQNDDVAKRNRSTDTILSTEPARRRARQGASVDVLPALTVTTTETATTPAPAAAPTNTTTTTTTTAARPTSPRPLLSIAAVASAKRLAFEERRRRTSQEKILLMRQKRSGQCTGGEDTPGSSQRALRLAQTVTTYQPQLEESSSFANRLSVSLIKQQQRQQQQQEETDESGARDSSGATQRTSHASSSMGTIAIDFSNLSMDTVQSLSSDDDEEEAHDVISSEINNNTARQQQQQQQQQQQRTAWSLQSTTIGGHMNEEAAPSRDGLTRTSAAVLGSWLDEFEEVDNDDHMLSNLHDHDEVERDVREIVAQLGETDDL